MTQWEAVICVGGRWRSPDSLLIPYTATKTWCLKQADRRATNLIVHIAPLSSA